MSAPKQVIVIRKDLKMRRGKECAQAAHASCAVFFNMIKNPETGLIKSEEGVFTYSMTHNNEAVHEWFMKSFKKITVTVNSEQELLDLYEAAKAAGLPCALIKDSGLTEFNEPTYTTLAIGPEMPEKIDPITGKLTLY